MQVVFATAELFARIVLQGKNCTEFQRDYHIGLKEKKKISSRSQILRKC